MDEESLNLYLAEAKSADAVLPNAAAGASAPMLQFERAASADRSNESLAEAKTADAVLPNHLDLIRLFQ